VLSALMAFGCRGHGPRCARPEEARRPRHPYPPCFILIVPLFHVTGCVPVMLACFAAG
jgi:hypothetical protein